MSTRAERREEVRRIVAIAVRATQGSSPKYLPVTLNTAVNAILALEDEGAQEPWDRRAVVWMVEGKPLSNRLYGHTKDFVKAHRAKGRTVVPLYTHPPTEEETP